MFFKKVITLIIIFMALSVAAESPIDQWEDSKKTYKDLINDGFQFKAYDSTSIRTDNNLILILRDGI